MPAPYLHYAVARDVFTRLPPELQSDLLPCLPLYFFGAQGADFCFLHPNGNALGRRMHQNSYEFFQISALLSANSPQIFAYLLGYATHYAADCAFHPFVYHLSGKSLVKHSRIERAIDEYFRSVNPSHDPFFSFFYPNLSERDKTEVFLVYAAYAAKTGAKPLVKTAFFHSISLFNAYMGSPFLRTKPFPRSVLENRSRRIWQHPKHPNVQSADGVNELYQIALSDSLSHVLELSESTKRKRPLPKKAFSKNFLSGL
jgi:hypothetical protein